MLASWRRRVTRRLTRPALRSTDAPGLLRFLVEGLGFEERLVVPGETEGTIAHAELVRPGGAGVMLGSVRDEGADLHAGDPASLYLVDPNPAAVLEQAVAAGAEALRPVEETYFGSRQCSLRDPAGNVWTVGTYGGAKPA